MNKEGFLFEVQRLALELERLIDKYGVRDSVISIMLTGLIDKTDDGRSRIKALYSYAIQDTEELDEMIDFIYNTWEPEEDKDDDDDIDLSGFLGELGIDLE